MPHDRTVTLRIGGQEITDITVSLNAVPTAKHRVHYPGGESCIGIEFAAVQHILGLVADQTITAEQARDTLHQLGEWLHGDNDELKAMLRMEADGS